MSTIPRSAPARPDTARIGRISRGVVDDAERLIVLALYVWLVARLVAAAASGGRAAGLLLLPSEGLVVVFMMLRRPAGEISRHPGEWALAMIGTCAPMLVSTSDGRALAPVPAAAAMFLAGLLIQIYAKATLGRSIGCIPANRGLKLGGPYRLVRHPMYAGYLLSHLAFLLMNPTPWNLAVYALCYGVQLPRLMAEERLLSRDPAYDRYRASVRYRLFPGVF
jgi:protein-S-isoprenylcysteine O-methyltransferase Ste14